MNIYAREARERLVHLLHGRLRRLAYDERRHVLNTLRGFDDPKKAARYLGRYLGRLLAGPAVSLVQGLMDGVDGKIAGSEIALTALLAPELRRTWPAGLSLQLQAVARREGLFDLAAIMMDMPAVDERFGPPRRQLPKDLKDIPLGRRKSMARANDIILMGKLLADPDVAVIRNLLDNPRLTTQEAVGLAAQKEISGEFLEMIALHPRWGSEYRVRIAIVHNPSTPLNVAIAFLHLLMAQDLDAVGTDTRLNGIVQRRAEHLLRRKRGGQAVRGSASSPD